MGVFSNLDIKTISVWKKPTMMAYSTLLRVKFRKSIFVHDVLQRAMMIRGRKWRLVDQYESRSGNHLLLGHSLHRSDHLPRYA